MENFIYHTPTKIYFGKDEEKKIGDILKEYHPHKILIHFGGGSIIKSGLLSRIESYLKEANLDYVLLGGVIPNPELALVKEGIMLCLKEGVDFILAIGGGSILDSAKLIAHGVANPDVDVWEYNMGIKTVTKSLPKGAILTLSAAGSEMSASCVISNSETKIKRGFNSPFNRFDFAICNPELTYTVNKYQTACGAVDIAMHTIERYFSIGEDTDLTDAISEAIIKNAFKFGLLAYNNPSDYNARANMMWASSLAHNGLTQCGRNFSMQVHQLEHTLSAYYPEIAHGAGLAALWCSWARYVYPFCKDRFIKYAKNVWGIDANSEEDILNTIKKQENYYKEIGMPTSLKELNIKIEDLPILALACSNDKTRIIPGYKPLAYEDILNIYQLAYDLK